MIRLVDGEDMFATRRDMLVNPVNCVGVMGKGLAATFKQRYPGNFAAYAAACAQGRVTPGRMLYTVNPDPDAWPRFIVNFPTKRHWRDRSRIGDVRAGLDDLARVIVETGSRSVAVPALGCGLGGLLWADVRPLVENALGDLPDVDVTVFAPRP